ncbi:hypothetical protein OG609_37570 [Streptomyces sp. NBC_01224]|nr:hypothetical protein OG609_37570 [Streptomyces sp. NBC_01224]
MQITASPDARLGISDVRSVNGTHALRRWDHAPRSVITVDAELAWAHDPYEPKPLDDRAWQGAVDSFSVWIYNETPTGIDDVVRFEFGQGSRTTAGSSSGWTSPVGVPPGCATRTTCTAVRTSPWTPSVSSRPAGPGPHQPLQAKRTQPLGGRYRVTEIGSREPVG